MNCLKRIRPYTKIQFFIFFIISIFVTQNARSEGLVYPDFATSMIREGKNQNKNDERFKRRQRLYKSASEKFVKLFSDIYSRNILAAKNSAQNNTYRIPRIVHQVWLGSPVPEKYYDWMQSWAKLQGWEYKLWTDADVSNIRLYNQDLYDRSVNFGEKSDILRLEILHRYGGVYVDVDYECLRPELFEEFHKSFDFYIGFEPLEHGFIKKFNLFKVCNAIIASTPKHPLVKDIMENMKANYYAYRPHAGTVEKTGPSYLTRIICEYELSNNAKHRNMYLPSTFFYPYTQAELDYFCAHPEKPVEFWPETLGIHYWSGSWRQPAAQISDPYLQKTN